MILFDINSFPSGIDGPSWFDLYNKGICIYDSKLHGNAPVEIDNKSVGLIDISLLTAEQELLLAKAINSLNSEFEEKNNKEIELLKENNQKLITYLTKINDEFI